MYISIDLVFAGNIYGKKEKKQIIILRNQMTDLNLFVKKYFLDGPVTLLKKIIWELAAFIVQRHENERHGNAIIPYIGPEKKKILKLVRKIKKETGTFYHDDELNQIYQAVRATAKIKGDIAEVGTYKGASAKVICEAKGYKNLYLFDRFEEGLPEVGKYDTGFLKGQYATSFEKVKSYLSQYLNVYFYKGTFPQTADPVKEKIFSFVNLDVDIYKSTRSCLEFFYPRMNKGGVIISDDYVTAEGVKKAFDNFFKDKPEPIIQVSSVQCLVVKQ